MCIYVYLCFCNCWVFSIYQWNNQMTKYKHPKCFKQQNDTGHLIWMFFFILLQRSFSFSVWLALLFFNRFCSFGHAGLFTGSNNKNEIVGDFFENWQKPSQNRSLYILYNSIKSWNCELMCLLWSWILNQMIICENCSIVIYGYLWITFANYRLHRMEKIALNWLKSFI